MGHGGNLSHSKEGLCCHEALVRHLHPLEGLDGDDAEADAPINEGAVYSNVIDSRSAHDRYGAYRGISCCKNMGTTRITQRYRTQGLNV
jgi:hypothetical protein